MSKPRHERIPVPTHRRFRWWLMTLGPAVVWVVAVGACVLLYRSEARIYSVKGLLTIRESVVSPLVDGRIVSLPVEPFQEVSEGAVVAVLDDTSLRAEITALLAEAEEARASIAATQQEIAAEHEDRARVEQVDRRRLEVDLGNAQLAALDRRAQIEISRIEVARLSVEQGRLQRMVETGIADQALLDETNFEIEAVQKSISENDTALTEAREQLEAARVRLNQLPGDSAAALAAAAAASAPFERHIDVITAQVDIIKTRLPGLVLRSPINGIVSESFASTGQNVAAGTPIVRISSQQPAQLVAYLPASARIHPETGDRVIVHRDGFGGAKSEGIVKFLGPAISAVPDQLLRSASMPEYALPIQIQVADATKFLPGEKVTVVFRKK